MGMTKCKACKQPISKAAKACPNCGEPQKQGMGFGRLLLVALVLFGALMYLVATSNHDGSVGAQKTPGAAPSKNVDVVSNYAWDGSVLQVERYLKKTLKDPDSFEAMEWSSVKKIETGFAVRCKYRAKNSFGGYVIENQIFTMNTQGVVLAVQDVK